MFAELTMMNTYVEGLTFVCVVLGAAFSLCQWRRQQKRSAAEFLKGLLDELRSDKIVAFLYDVDYDEDWYGPNFHGSERENRVDRALSFLSFMCYLHFERLFGKTEFMFFEYELKRVLRNEQVIDYLYNLYHFSARENRSSPFEHLISYGVKGDLFDKTDFFDPTSYKRVDYLHRYLNF